MRAGNPHFTNSLIKRRNELLKRLTESPPEGWSKEKAKFAYDYGLTDRKVKEYYMTLLTAGLLDKILPSNGTAK